MLVNTCEYGLLSGQVLFDWCVSEETVVCDPQEALMYASTVVQLCRNAPDFSRVFLALEEHRSFMIICRS